MPVERLSQPSICPDCAGAGYSEAECTIGRCESECSSCAEVAKSVRDVTSDDVFWQAVEHARGN
jgi:hypothetical protein